MEIRKFHNLMYDIMMDTIYVIGISYFIYQAVNQATDGRLETEVKNVYTKGQTRLKRAYSERAEYKRTVGRVVWDAIRIVEDNDDDDGMEGTI